MIRKACVLVCTAFVATAAGAAGWRHSVNEHGVREARGAGAADFGSVHVPATLSLKCQPATDGAVAWELELGEAARLSEFGLDDFEGPDAKSGKKPLNEIAPEGGILRTTIRTPAAGFYGIAPDTFVLSVAAPANAASDAALLADLITPQTSALLWSVASLKAAGAKLVARFDAKGAAAALRETMMGCGPAPAFETPALQAQLGRAPAASGLWTLRPLEWRLKALLGSGYADFKKRMRDAPALEREGDVWYVLARPGRKDAAALMFTASGDVEVIRANAADVKRMKSGGGTISAPAAVREYIAASAK